MPPGRLDSVPAGKRAEAWLVRVLVNLCRDRWRKAGVREAADRRLDEASGVPDPETLAVARMSVSAALDRLPARRRAVVALCELEGLPVREVARLLGVSAVTVRWHRAAAMKELAQRLGASTEPLEEVSHVR